MDNQNPYPVSSLCSYPVSSLSSSLERLHLGNQNSFGERGEHIGSPPLSSPCSHPQLRPLASTSHGDLERSVMPFRPSHALQGFSFDLPSTTMDRLQPFRSAGCPYGSSSIRAPEQGVLPEITEDYLRLGFLRDDLPTNYPTQESSYLSGSNSFSSPYHLNPSTLNTQETPYDVGDIEQRGCNFYGNNLGRFVAQRSPPYACTPISINPAWSSGSPYALFDDGNASSSQSNQGGYLSGITGQSFDSHHTSDLNSSSGNPFLNTLSGGSGFREDEVVEAMRLNIYLRAVVRDLVMKGPISPVLAMRKEVLPHLLSLLDDGDAVILANILKGLILRPSSLYGVMKDKHGCHLFNELLDKCGYEHKRMIVSLVTRADILLELASDCYGNYCVGKLIALVKGLPDLCDHVISALSMIVSDLMNHKFGFSLIECCLKHLTYEQNSFIFEEAQRNCHELARHQNGVFALQRCIEKLYRHHRVEIVNELVRETIGLAQDTYGNFVIKFIIDLEDSYYTTVICSRVAEHLAELSLQKTGSYVVERCLESSAGRFLLQKLEEFTDEVLEEISTHPFGNYVLQTALKVEKEKGRHPTLARRIKQILRNLRTYPYAINVLKHVH